MKRLTSEEGFALVPAIAVTIIVLVLGTVVLASVNVQSNQSGAERTQEGSFQLAEGALNSQVLQLSRTWPSTVAAAYPACNQSTTATATCTGTALASNYTTVAPSGGGPNGGSDFASTPAWSTRVIDDAGGKDYYSDVLATPSAYAYDQNANGSVWVRSESNVGGERSVLVSLVSKGEPREETLPRAVVLAGAFRTTNNGKKVIVDAQGNSATAGSLSVRCSTPAPSADSTCLGFDQEKKGQLSPENAYQSPYMDGTGVPSATNRTSLDAAALARLKLRAQNLGTYYATGCPASLTGEPIYIENANCSYTGGGAFNSAANPGVVVLGAGTLSFGGSRTYYGLIYNANGQGTAPASGPCTSAFQNDVVDLGGNSLVVGAIFVDKCGVVVAGSSGTNIIYDVNVFSGVTSDGIAASVENSFRILPSP